MKSRMGNSLIALLFTSLTLFSCKDKQSDAEIKAAIDQKVQNNEGMKNLTASVSNGVVTLNGSCKDEECRKDCAEAVKDVKGVKQVVNNIDIASTAAAPSVQISGDDQLRSDLNNVLKSYSTVQADVNDGVITLRGEIKRDELQNLMVALNDLRPKKIDNQLAIK